MLGLHHHDTVCDELTHGARDCERVVSHSSIITSRLMLHRCNTNTCMAKLESAWPAPPRYCITRSSQNEKSTPTGRSKRERDGGVVGVTQGVEMQSVALELPFACGALWVTITSAAGGDATRELFASMCAYQDRTNTCGCSSGLRGAIRCAHCCGNPTKQRRELANRTSHRPPSMPTQPWFEKSLNKISHAFMQI